MDRTPFSRRDVLKAGAFIGLGAAMGRSLTTLARAVEPLPLITKAIAKSGERLPVIGLGANAFNVAAPVDLAARREVLSFLPSLGGAVVDTAQSYGRSEQIIGELMATLGNREQLFISTKAPLGGDNRSPELVIEASMRNLRVQRIDLMMAHNLYRVDEFLPAFRRAKDARRIRYIGVSASSLQHSQLLKLMREQPLDFIQVDYSLANRNIATRVLDLALEKKISVMCSEPFGGRQRAGSMFGLLAGKPLPDWATEFDAFSWAQVLLKYAAGHPAMTVVIPGTTRLKHLQDNMGAAHGRLPDADMRKRIEQYWDVLVKRA